MMRRVFVLLAFLLVSCSASADTWVRMCTSNPGNGVGCPSVQHVAQNVTPPAGLYHIVAAGAVFTGWETVSYYAPGTYAGLINTLWCSDTTTGLCADWASDVLFWGVGSVRISGGVTLLGNAVSSGQGQFGLVALQDILFALGVAVCGVLGIGVGVRLI